MLKQTTRIEQQGNIKAFAIFHTNAASGTIDSGCLLKLISSELLLIQLKFLVLYTLSLQYSLHLETKTFNVFTSFTNCF